MDYNLQGSRVGARSWDRHGDGGSEQSVSSNRGEKGTAQDLFWQ